MIWIIAILVIVIMGLLAYCVKLRNGMKALCNGYEEACSDYECAIETYKVRIVNLQNGEDAGC